MNLKFWPRAYSNGFIIGLQVMSLRLRRPQTDFQIFVQEKFEEKRKQRTSFESVPNDFLDAFLREIDRADEKDITGTVRRKITVLIYKNIVLAEFRT